MSLQKCILSIAVDKAFYICYCYENAERKNAMFIFKNELNKNMPSMLDYKYGNILLCSFTNQ